MQFELPYLVVRHVKTKYEEDIDNPLLDMSKDIDQRWKDNNDLFVFETNNHDKDVVAQFLEICDTLSEKQEYVQHFAKYTNKKKYVAKVTSSDKLTVLKTIPLLVQDYIAKQNMSNNWFYMKHGYSEELQPFALTLCKNYAADKYNEERVRFEFSAILNNEVVTEYRQVHKAAMVRAKTLTGLFEALDIIPETETLNEIYAEQLITFTKMYGSTGEVYEGKGQASKMIERYGSDYKQSFWFKDTGDNKVVVDNIGPNIDKTGKSDAPADKDKSKMGAYNAMVQMPVLPYVWAFHLEEHCWLNIHVNQLVVHKFAGKQLMEKLILPESHKALIDLLMTSTKEDIADIIDGKKGGSFIMATGEPGTGKTLTSEVCSETIGKSLYKVQCSQLGLSVTEIEKNLTTVLNRATRWGSILLMDEADVYVRRRGSDIEQNAIVGVFLRNLEYYNGILFMTSNLDAIDDAILSRATAHVIYKKPSSSDIEAIYNIQSELLNTKLSTEQLTILKSLEIVGRDVKAVLKLSKFWLTHYNKTTLTNDEFTTILSFVPATRLALEIKDDVTNK